MKVPGADAIIVRHGDIGVKTSRVQSWMEQTLAENLDAMLSARSIEGTVEQHWGRLFIRTPAPHSAARAAADVFGVVSASPARSVQPQMAAISKTLADVAEKTYDRGSFAVDARRAGDHEFTSQDVGRIGGEAIWEAVADQFDPEVDLDDPDHTFAVEVRDTEAFVFRGRIDGPGGLPIGTQEPLVALISGGIDSPVAAWLAMKRGAPIIPLYFDLGEYGGADHRARAVDTVRTIAASAPGQDWQLRVADIGSTLESICNRIGDTRMLSVRRLMLRAAGEIAAKTGAEGIVTGESIGQKSSQTVTNLHVTDRITDWPVHRPLLAFDKQEIIARARSIGTYETATVDTGCNRIAPDNPETAAPIDRVEGAEPAAFEEWAREAAAEVDILQVEPKFEPNGT
ncbi:tRNA sulfurtransferase [Halodesulfurarchaeum sp.]|uniref:tRNA sulfurtransferase n=1 Tax=Halodesulfurarchaeum sp. TaxID=1980530 RepID=UPI002FC2E05D